MLAALASAWTAPELTCICHSAPAPGSPVEINADCSDQPGLPPFATTARFWYSVDNQSSWTEVAMSRVAGQGYDSTFGGSFTAPGAGAASYYVCSRNGTNYATQAPFNSGNTWPPGGNLLAATADEPAGDATNPEGPWLDLTGIWFGYSGDRFYARITNDHTSWPLSSGLLGPWYVYSVGFRNPEAPCDSYAFILTYANALGIFTTGLYEANEFTEELIRIGDVDVSTSGNCLDMRCRISDLTARALFGPWPNSCGYLTSLTGNTQSADIQQRHYERDTTTNCRFYPRTPGFTTGQNRSPALSQPRVVPSSGTPETDFWFSVRYTDADSNLPVARRLVVDSDTFLLAPNQHRYWVGALFDTYRSGFAPGLHWFHFSFDDGMATVTSPADTFRVQGVGIEETHPSSIDDMRLTIAPNPVTDGCAVLRVRGFQGPRVQVAVYNSLGRLVRDLSVPNSSFDICHSSFPLDCSALSSGVYVVRLRAAGFEGTSTLLVHR